MVLKILVGLFVFLTASIKFSVIVKICVPLVEGDTLR